MENDRGTGKATIAGVAMSLSLWTRESHRWVSIVFTVAVVANFVFRAVASGEPPPWLTYSPLPPLFLQLFTGLYLFALPYIAKRRGRARA
jgi:hypothetical protein